MNSRLGIALLFFLTLFPATAESNRLVTAVSSPDFSREEIDRFVGALGIRIGQPLDPRALDRGLHNLHQDGKLQFLFVETEATAGGQHVTLRGAKLQKLRHWVTEGLEAEILDEIRGKWLIEEGQMISVRGLAETKERLRQAYESRGYASPDIKISTEELRGGRDADLVIEVTKNSPTLIQKVDVTGGKPDENVEFKQIAGVASGQPLVRKKLEDAAERINAYLRLNQYPTSKVEDTVLTFSPDKLHVDVQFQVRLNDRFQFEFYGNRVYEEAQLRAFFTDEILSQSDSAQRLAKLIESKYQSVGFHFCKVTIQTQHFEKQRLQVIRFSIDEGSKVLIDGVYFTGGSDTHQPMLEKLFWSVGTGPVARGVFSEEAVKETIPKLIKKLEESGHLTASITGPKLVFSTDKKGVQLFFEAELGVETRVGDFLFKGNQAFVAEELRRAIGVKSGAPLSREDIEGVVRDLVLFYRTHGYADVKIGPAEGKDFLVFSSDRKLGHLHFLVEEGKRYEFGNITIDGTKKTQDKVLVRELKFSKGDVFNPALLSKGEEDLAVLGLFSRVEVTTSVPKGSSQKDVQITARENRPGIGELGFGALYEDPLIRFRIFADLAYRNLFGLNQTVSARNELSLPLSVAQGGQFVPFVEYSTILGYRAPYPLDIPLTFSAQVGIDRFAVSTSGAVATLLTRARIEGKLEKRFSPHFVGLYRLFRYERTTTEVTNDPASTKTEYIGSTGPGIVLDFRNDTFNPTRGSYHTFDIELASPILLSQPTIGFVMALSRNSLYIPLFSPFQMTLYAGLGYARSLITNSPVPRARLTNDLALGGQASIRGFNARQFSPPDLSYDTGFYNLRGEVSVPLFWNISAAIFADSGQIFPNIGFPGLFVHVPREDSVGIGFRYRTPVGPIVVDFARGLGNNAQAIKFYFTVGTL